MNIYVLFSLLLFLAPGGCPIYSIDLSTLEVPNDFQNELTLQSMLSSELHQYRSRLNANAKNNELSAAQHFEQAHPESPEDLLERNELMRSIEDRIKATHYAAASRDELVAETDAETKPVTSKVYRSTSDESTFLGTNLFGNYPKKCFSSEEIALMSARKDFEALIPKSYPQSLLCDGIVYTLMKYFNSVNQVIHRMSDLESRRLLQRAFYDALGGYLRFYLVPVAQVSYYAGRLKLCTVERLVTLYRQCQLVLNTNGNGWRTPVPDVLSQLKIVHIKPIRINEEKGCENDASSCALLDQSCLNEDAQKDQMIVPLPHLESEDSNGHLSNIFLPFKHRRIYNLRSPNAAFILVKFFKTLNNCYRFQGISPRTYNQKLRNWIRDSLQLHYRDEVFYPGLGGVLQIYETLGICSTKPTEQVGENEDSVLSEDDCKDYENLSDEADNVTEKDSDNQTERPRKKKKNKEAKASSKKSRSPPLSYDPCATSDHKDTNPNEEEECVDCDDDNYVAYIAAILALLLLILLITICCCLQRRWKRSHGIVEHRNPKPKEKPKEKSSEKSTDKHISDVEAAPMKPEEKDTNESCWSNLFRSRKKHRKIRKFEDSPEPNHIIPGMGMGLIGSPQTELSAYPLPLKMVNSKKYMQPKKSISIDDSYERDSFTSTSSLACFQFQRKYTPLLSREKREKRDKYYAISERNRSKPKRERKPQKPQTIVEDELPDKKDSAVKVEETEGVKELYSHKKLKRQEGGLSSIPHESKSDSSRNRYNDTRKETSQDRSHERKHKPSSIIQREKSEMSSKLPESNPNSLDVPSLVISEPQAESPETILTPLLSPVRTNDACEGSASWETLEDEDSK